MSDIRNSLLRGGIAIVETVVISVEHEASASHEEKLEFWREVLNIAAREAARYVDTDPPKHGKRTKDTLKMRQTTADAAKGGKT